MNKVQKRKEIERQMIERSFELRQMTGRGWDREALEKDPEWKELNEKLKALHFKK
jgi:hypothetical protein